MVANDGTLKWILDGYTTTDRLSLCRSGCADGTNYMRNSVKVVIDAYDGTLAAYVSAPADPIIRTWARIFPGHLRPLDSMPADLRAHIRYPDELYRVQTGALHHVSHGRRRTTSITGRTSGRSRWRPRSEASGAVHAPHRDAAAGGEERGVHLHGARSRPGGRTTWRPGWRRGTTARTTASSGSTGSPRQSLVFGPQQIVNRINQDTEVSRQITLWDQRGSRGDARRAAGASDRGALIYVQPLYLRAEGGRIPELKRVVVAYQNRVVMRETLDDGLAEMFGGGVRSRESGVGGINDRGYLGRIEPPTPDSQLPTLLREAKQHYQAAIQAQRDLDWAKYGQEMRRLGETLDRLNARSGTGQSRP